MKTQANDKEARRKRRATKQAYKDYGAEKPVPMSYYYLNEETKEDFEAAVGSLNLPTKSDWYY